MLCALGSERAGVVANDGLIEDPLWRTMELDAQATRVQFDILPRLKSGDSYGAHPGIEPTLPFPGLKAEACRAPGQKPPPQPSPEHTAFNTRPYASGVSLPMRPRIKA